MTYINTALVRMLTAVSGLRDRMSEERGQDLLEYALLGGFIATALTAVAVVAIMTGAVQGMACGIGEYINLSSTPLADCVAP